ncbi:MAG: hypothetical protein OEZ58_15360 [Gammaproteobacteria bacterium]|nr:hypothetical protein [Gammaproteobacteria bacterium]MDH5730373.1 hypothetical protein [Gammaproteobacteria bacterium]
MNRTKYNNILLLLISILCSSCEYRENIEKSVFTQACMAGAEPIISVADFNADGMVDGADLDELDSQLNSDTFHTLYDRNIDGKIDSSDRDLAQADIGLSSSELDRSIVGLFKSTQYLQEVSRRYELGELGFHKGADSIAGHGEHWNNDRGGDLIEKGGELDFEEAIGLNVPYASAKVWALFWGLKAEPVFENGATDYPAPGGDWETQQVIAFSDTPPSFTGHESEVWHTHAGLCNAAQERNGNVISNFTQHESYASCQARESGFQNIGEKIPWDNMWMLHAWIFVPNPKGLFANTHPCLDPNAPSEDELNKGKTIPEFFQHHH